MFGKSATGHGVELTYGAIPSIAISSSSTATPAIDLKGNTSASGYHGLWASNNLSGNILIQSTSASGGGIRMEGTSATDVALRLAVTNSNIVSQILSQSGTIAFIGSGASNRSLLLEGDSYIGNRKDGNAVEGVTPIVTASNANILIQANDQYQFGNTTGKNVNFNSTGALTMEAYNNSYGGTISWTGNRTFGTQFSSITLGEAAENYSFTLNNTLTSTGNITAYTNNFNLADGVGLVSSSAGTITINANGNFVTDGTTRRIISSLNGNININADADASGNGIVDLDYLTLNPGTGNTSIRCETLDFSTTSNAVKPYFNGTGSVKIEPSDASFQLVDKGWFYFDQDNNGISGLTIGKPTNTGNITMSVANNIAGFISLYGGIVSLNAPLTSSADGDIFIKSNLNINGGGSINGTSSIIKSAGTGTLTMQSMDRLNSGTITASGSGKLNVVLWSDFDNNNNGGVAINAITTNGGNVWVGGSNSNGGSYTWKGLAVGDGPSVGSFNNNHNAIDFYGPIITNGGDVLVWGGNGYLASGNGITMLSGPSTINSGNGNITLIADNIAANNLTITSTGTLSLVPYEGSYPADITFSGAITSGNFNGSSTFDFLNINNFSALSGLSIGYYDGQMQGATPVIQANSSNINSNFATSIAGNISLYGNGLNVNNNLASTSGGNISLTSNTLSINGSAIFSSTGNLLIQPITPGTTIGLAGGAGTLGITATNFNTNFADGFSELRIGNNASGNISLGSPITLKDNLVLNTSNNLLLNEIVTLNNSYLNFKGNNIVPAVNKFIKTNGVGRLIISFNNAVSKLFPMGTDYYNPVTIKNNTGINSEFYVSLSDGVFLNGSNSGTSVPWSPRVNLTWRIGNNAGNTGAGSVDFDFGWNAANSIGTFTSPRLENFSGTDWFVTNNVPSFDLGARTLSYTGYTGDLNFENYSAFSIGEIGTVLPITWLSFSGKKTGKAVELNWETSSEINNAYFIVERSMDGNSFSEIGRVSAVLFPGTLNKYQFIDRQALSGNSFYRLKQIDVNGKISYGKIINFSSENEQNYKLVVIPGSNQVYINAPVTLTGKTVLVIYDGLGRQLMAQQLQPGQNIIPASILKNKSAYFIKVLQAGKMIFSDKFIL